MNTHSLSPSPSINFAARFLTLDDYVLLARKKPFLLAVLPAAFAVGAWLPSLIWWQVLPLGVMCLLLGLCGDLGRIGGKAEEKKLFARWGGKPTTRMLRHRDSPFDEQKLKRLHAHLSSLTGVKAPTKNLETKRPGEADKIYAGYTTYLRIATTNVERFPLVRVELINYGFARNCWGLRRFGIGISTLGVFVVFSRLYCLWQHTATLISAGIPIVLAVFSLFLFIFWTCWVREDWVRDVANSYASRLLEAATTLPLEEGIS